MFHGTPLVKIRKLNFNRILTSALICAELRPTISTPNHCLEQQHSAVALTESHRLADLASNLPSIEQEPKRQLAKLKRSEKLIYEFASALGLLISVSDIVTNA